MTRLFASVKISSLSLVYLKIIPLMKRNTVFFPKLQWNLGSGVAVCGVSRQPASRPIFLYLHYRQDAANTSP